jgi:hypothetical protein
LLHPLEGCRAKLERAKELVQGLEEEVASFLAAGTHSVVRENQFDQRRYVFKLVGPPVPLRFAVLAGEIIHHLRSCVDHIVWALATRDGQTTDDRIAFPVCSTPEKFRKAVRNGVIRDVPDRAEPLIEAFQPYQSADPPNSVVQVLHDLDIADKHKLLVVVSHMMVLGNTLVITRNDCADPTFGIELPPISVGKDGRPMAQYPLPARRFRSNWHAHPTADCPDLDRALPGDRAHNRSIRAAVLREAGSRFWWRSVHRRAKKSAFYRGFLPLGLPPVGRAAVPR